MSTKKPAEHPRRLQLFRQFLLLKKLSRDLNYDVIIERTREGILCRDNQQKVLLKNNLKNSV